MGYKAVTQRGCDAVRENKRGIREGVVDRLTE